MYTTIATLINNDPDKIGLSTSNEDQQNADLFEAPGYANGLKPRTRSELLNFMAATASLTIVFEDDSQPPASGATPSGSRNFTLSFMKWMDHPDPSEQFNYTKATQALFNAAIAAPNSGLTSAHKAAVDAFFTQPCTYTEVKFGVGKTITHKDVAISLGRT